MPSRTYVAQRLGAFAGLLKASDLAGFRLEPHAPFSIRDRYFDTDDGELLRRGMSLRVREQEGERRALIRPVRPGDAGPTLEVALEPSGRVEALEPLRNVLLEITGATEPPVLHPLLSLRQYRTPRAAYDGDRLVGLLSFDVVVFELPDGPHASNELDIELAAAGEASDFEALDPILRAEGLRLVERTKMERGIEQLPRRLTEPLLLLPHEREALDEVIMGGDPVHQRRARVLLLDARGFKSSTIANQLGLSTARVRHWKQLFREQRLDVFEGAIAKATAAPAYTVSELVTGADDSFGGVPSDEPAEAPSLPEPVFEGEPDPVVEPEPEPTADPSPEPSSEVNGDGAVSGSGLAALAGDIDDLLEMFQPSATDTPLLDADPEIAPLDPRDLSMGSLSVEDEEVDAEESDAFTHVAWDEPPAREHDADEQESPDEPAWSSAALLEPEDEGETVTPAPFPVDPSPTVPDVMADLEPPAFDEPGAEELDPRTEPQQTREADNDAEPEADAAPEADDSPRPTPEAATSTVPPSLPFSPPVRRLEEHEPTPTRSTTAPITPLRLVSAPPPRPSQPRPRLHPDDPLVGAAHEVLGYHVGQLGWCAADLDRDRGPYRLFLAVHRVRLALEVFAPVLPADAVGHLHAGLRRLAVGLDRYLELAHDQNDRQWRALDAVRETLQGRSFARWIGRAERLVERLGSQHAAGISAPDDAPFPWDDYDGDAIDQPVRARVRHLLGTALWTRVEALMVWDREGDGPSVADAYALALAASGVRFVLGLAEGTAPEPVRRADALLETAENDFVAAHRGQTARFAPAWASLRSAELRGALADVLRQL